MSYSSVRICSNCGTKNRVSGRHLADTGRCGTCKARLPPQSEPIEVDSSAFDEIVRAAHVPVLVDFWAAWCGATRCETGCKPQLYSPVDPVETANGSSASLLSNMGIASTSFMGAVLGKHSSPSRSSGQATASHSQNVMSLPPVPQGHDTLQFLEKCHAFGAAGIQAQITGDPHKLRARAEQLGMWVEAMISIRQSSPETLEEAISNAKEAGCTIARDGLLGGRRYESFNTLADWKAWVIESMDKLEMAIPIFDKHKFTLALENHKDWTSDEYVKLFKTYSSEYFGACLDFGNNISLLDGLMETIEAVAPYTKATHFKDLAVEPYKDGFLLSEVPLGTGVLDLPKTIALVQRANPSLHLAVEMITRDPLKVPCLEDRYWITFPDRNGIFLARTSRFVNEHKSATPLPTPEDLTHSEHARLEEENIKACFRYAQERA